MISPDGRWMAYSSNEFGKGEVYVRPFPDVNSGGRWQVSTSGGTSPLWSPDGRELFYRNGDTTMAVEVETESTFKSGKPQTLFRGFQNSPYAIWDIHPDGSRFLMIKESTVDTSTEDTPRPKITVVTNWFEELKERVPAE